MTLDIIMPCYYANEVIRPAIEKISQQTIRDKITLIIVNDCSPNTECEYQDIIKEYSSKLHIRYFKTPYHSGPGITRQIGLEHATSDLVMFQDDDDQIAENDTLEYMISQINTNKFASITGKICYKNLIENTSELWSAIRCSVQGTIFNRELLQQRNISFESPLSFKEEDGTFSAKVYLATLDYEHLLIDKCVYIRICNDNHESITQVISLSDSIVYLIGMTIYCAKYLMDNDIADKDLLHVYLKPAIGGVPILLDVLLKQLITQRTKLSKILFNNLLFYIEIYFLLIKYYKIDIQNISREKLIQDVGHFYLDDPFFDSYDCDLVYNFKKLYPQYLNILRDLFVEK